MVWTHDSTNSTVSQRVAIQVAEYLSRDCFYESFFRQEKTSVDKSFLHTNLCTSTNCEELLRTIGKGGRRGCKKTGVLPTMYTTFGRTDTCGVSSADVEMVQEALSLRNCAHAGPPTEPFEAVTVNTYSTPARRDIEARGEHGGNVVLSAQPLGRLRTSIVGS